jgi:hypothetical protein
MKMSTPNVRCRTNYFAVTDEMKFKTIMAACLGDGKIEVFEGKQNDGSIKYGFLSDGNITGLPYKYDEDKKPVVTLNIDEAVDIDSFDAWDVLCEELQKILPIGEAIILTKVGWEKMRIMIGECEVITKDDCQGVYLSDAALEAARKMLDDPNYTTQMNY